MNNVVNSPALHLGNTTKKSDDVETVSDLSLSLDRGRVFAFLNPSGADGTVTVEMHEGAIKPDEGRTRVLDLDLVTQTTALRNRIGIILQGRGAYPSVRIGEMLSLVASYSANPLDTDWLLEAVGLEHHYKTNYCRLSNGQQQRLSLTCTLVGRPELVFLDEPTAGLDAQSRLAAWDLISLLRRDGVTIVLAMYLVGEAESLVDSVAIISQEHLVVAGTTEEATSTGALALQGMSSSIAMKVNAQGGLDFEKVNRSFNESDLSQQLQCSSDGGFSLVGEASPCALTALAQSCRQQEVLITLLNRVT